MKNAETNNKKKLMNAQKGVAIEMALVMLVLVFAICSLLVGITAAQVKRFEKRNERLTERLELDGIGEDFCASVANGTHKAWSVGGDKYKETIEENGNLYMMTLCRYDDGEILLSVTLEKNESDGACKVVLWDYR